MVKYKVFLTRRIPQKAIDKMLDYGIDLEMNEDDRVLSKKEIIKGIEGKDGLLCLLTDTIDEEVIEHGKGKLRIIANCAVGYNNIDIKIATKYKIPVTNTPGVLTNSTADLTFGLLLAISRRIVESDKFVRAGKFKGWGPLLLLGNDVYGKTLGIIGCGRIGAAVAQRAVKGFHMKVLYYDTHRIPELEKELNIEYCLFENLLKESDFISLHVPLTKETKHLISTKEFAMMKSSAYLINTSRGPVIDEKALVKCLHQKRIAGAALDVYENEPEIAQGLCDLENVILTAHIASATIDTRTEMGLIAVKNLIEALEGKKPKNCVNIEIYS